MPTQPTVLTPGRHRTPDPDPDIDIDNGLDNDNDNDSDNDSDNDNDNDAGSDPPDVDRDSLPGADLGGGRRQRGDRFERLAGVMVAAPWRVVAVWAVALIGLGLLGTGLPDRLAAGGFDVPGSPSLAVQDVLRQDFPGQSADPVVIVLHAADPQQAAALPAAAAAIADTVAGLDGVVGVRGPADPGGAGQVSTDGRTAYLSVAVAGDQSEQLRRTAAIESAVARDSDGDGGPEVTVGGKSALYNSINDISRSDLESAELTTFPITLLVLLVVFGTAVAAGLPVLLALVSLGITLGLLSLLTLVMPLSIYVTNTASVIGIGVGIDYALFIVTRYREELAAGRDVPGAIVRSIATSGRSICVSGLTVVVALAGMFLVDIQGFRSMAIGSMVVVTLAVLAGLTLLPAVLALLGRRIDRLAVRRPNRARHRASGWHRWTVRVMRRPVRFLVGALVVLFALGAPLGGIVLGQPSAQTLPEGTGPRVAAERLADAFGPGAVGPIEILVPIPAGSSPAESAARVGALTAALAADPDVAAVLSAAVPGVDAGPMTSMDGDWSRVTVIGRADPQSDEAGELVRRIRGQILPAAGLPGALVGGPGAADLDLTDTIAERLPWVVGAVLTLSFLLLVVALRSIVLPFKAIVMNLMSVAAAYGVVVAIFQWGWGADLLQFRPEGFIQAFVPLFLFSVLFGLSMDYEVFLMTRMREEWLRTGSNQAAVAHGLERTGRTVTCAALIMVVVFAAFTGSRLLAFKAMGFGLATAVLVDATVVRVVAVPAAMRLLGRLNWWMPRRLDRLLPHLEPVDPGPGSTAGPAGRGPAARPPTAVPALAQ